MPEMSLDDQVAIVTGSGQGLGAAYARELAGRGAAVVVNDIPGTDRAAGVVSSIEGGGGTAFASYNDVATRAGGGALVDDAVRQFGRVDILVNNAGIIRPALFEDLTDDDIDSNINVHLKSMFYVTQPAYDVMRERGYGRIVNISSNNSFGVEGMINYCAAKAGVLGLTNGLALEAIRHGVLVNSVMPNATTEMAVEATAARPVPRIEENKRFLDAYGAVTQYLEPGRASALVAYLASPACNVTGEIFSQVGPRYSRVFFGVSEGWMSAKDGPPSAEDLGERFDDIRATDQFTVPTSVTDDFVAAASRLGE